MHRQALASESGSPALRGIPLSKPSDHRLALLFAKHPGAVRIVFSNTPAKSNEAFSDTSDGRGWCWGIYQAEWKECYRPSEIVSLPRSGLGFYSHRTYGILQLAPGTLPGAALSNQRMILLVVFSRASTPASLCSPLIQRIVRRDEFSV